MIVIRIGNNEFAGYSIITNLIMFLFTFKHIYGSATLSLISISSGEKNIRNLIDYPANSLYPILITIILKIMTKIVPSKISCIIIGKANLK